MKNFTVSFLGLCMLLISSCTIEFNQDRENDSTVQSDSTAYICPMNCENGKTYKHTGQCPKCRMQLKAK